MKKQSYFSHDSNARNDEKILSLRMKLGIEGYGVYFMLLERLRDEADYTSLTDYNAIAFEFRVSPDIVRAVVEDFGLFLFKEDGKRFFSDSFMQRMRKKDAHSERCSAGGKKAMEQRWGKVQQQKEPEPTQPKTPQLATGQSIDYDKLVGIFNDTTKGVFGHIRLPLSEKRKSMIRARVSEYGKESFVSVINNATKSDFLRGQGAKGFVMSFDWMIKPTNFEKILSGNYNNKQNGKDTENGGGRLAQGEVFETVL